MSELNQETKEFHIHSGKAHYQNNNEQANKTTKKKEKEKGWNDAEMIQVGDDIKQSIEKNMMLVPPKIIEI